MFSELYFDASLYRRRYLEDLFSSCKLNPEGNAEDSNATVGAFCQQFAENGRGRTYGNFNGVEIEVVVCATRGLVVEYFELSRLGSGIYDDFADLLEMRFFEYAKLGCRGIAVVVDNISESGHLVDLFVDDTGIEWESFDSNSHTFDILRISDDMYQSNTGVFSKFFLKTNSDPYFSLKK